MMKKEVTVMTNGDLFVFLFFFPIPL